MDESIRWLWTQSRTREAIEIVRRGAKINKRPFSFSIDIDKKSIEKNSTKPQLPPTTYGIHDLFRLPTIRLRTIITAFNWFAVSLCFYGLAFNTGSLPGDPFLVFFILSFMDLPGFFLITLIVNKTGRRSLSATLLFIGGISCIITTIVPRGKQPHYYYYYFI
jgi:hypothetical protein